MNRVKREVDSKLEEKRGIISEAILKELGSDTKPAKQLVKGGFVVVVVVVALINICSHQYVVVALINMFSSIKSDFVKSGMSHSRNEINSVLYAMQKEGLVSRIDGSSLSLY